MIDKATIMHLLAVIGSREDASSLDIGVLVNRVIQGDCYTVLDTDGLPLGIVGADVLDNGAVELWSVLSPYIKEQPFIFTKSVKEILRVCTFKTMQMYVDSNEKVHRRFAEYLGFEHVITEEPVVNNKGQSFLLYRRVA